MSKILEFHSSGQNIIEIETKRNGNDDSEIDHVWASGWNQEQVEDKHVNVVEGDRDLAELGRTLDTLKISGGQDDIEESLSAKSNFTSQADISVSSPDLPEWYTDRCDICNKNFTGKKPYAQHLSGKDHLKKMSLTISTSSSASNPNPFGTFRYHCDICDVPFNTERDMQFHKEGKKHLEKMVKASKAPTRNMPQTKKAMVLHDCTGHDLTEFSPRSYQLELYQKAMTCDAVCFLPTGL